MDNSLVLRSRCLAATEKVPDRKLLADLDASLRLPGNRLLTSGVKTSDLRPKVGLFPVGFSILAF